MASRQNVSHGDGLCKADKHEFEPVIDLFMKFVESKPHDTAFCVMDCSVCWLEKLDLISTVQALQWLQGNLLGVSN